MPTATWEFDLTYDFRAMIAWAMDHGVGVSDEFRERLEVVILDKSKAIDLDRHEIDVMQLIGLEAEMHAENFRTTSGNFLYRLDALSRGQPTGQRRTAEPPPKESQGSLFG